MLKLIIEKRGNMKNVCQSCGMPMIQGEIDRRGTELDGQRSDVYCNLCYLNGKFLEPHLTMEQMVQKGLEGIESSDQNKMKKWILRKTYPALIKNLGRWK